MTVLLAMVLDALLGEPKWLWSRLPHPAVIMGRAVAALDRRLNRGRLKLEKGQVALTILVVGAGLVGWLITLLPGSVADVILGAILLAQRSLVDHVAAVARGLRRNLPEGRAAVAMIVSRDTTQMDDSDVARSAIESGAENLSDGLVAPVMFFALFGLPGLMIYKAVNTADSMIGYLNADYRDFGWAAAKFDDLLNWVPARVTAVLIWITDRKAAPWRIRADARRHRSPNAGWPEAAMAYKLNVALAGPRSYDGKKRDFPFVNPTGKMTLKASTITTSIETLWQVWGLTIIVALLLALITPF